MSHRDPLFDPPEPEGLDTLRVGIAFRLSASFASFARPGQTMPGPGTLAETAAGSIIPTLSDSMVESLTRAAAREAS